MFHVITYGGNYSRGFGVELERRPEGLYLAGRFWHFLYAFLIWRFERAKS